MPQKTVPIRKPSLLIGYHYRRFVLGIKSGFASFLFFVGGFTGFVEEPGGLLGKDGDCASTERSAT